MVYLQLAENVLAEQRKVRIKDVSKVVADNPPANILSKCVLSIMAIIRKRVL